MIYITYSQEFSNYIIINNQVLKNKKIVVKSI